MSHAAEPPNVASFGLLDQPKKRNPSTEQRIDVLLGDLADLGELSRPNVLALKRIYEQLRTN